MNVEYEWRGAFASAEVGALHAEGFGRRLLQHDWRGQVEAHSLGWVCARFGGRLVGWVNVPWDGDTHAFIIDTLVAADHRRGGVGRRLIETCVVEARAAGCEWLHVDFDEHLRTFYIEACGFDPAPAGVMALS